MVFGWYRDGSQLALFFKVFEPLECLTRRRTTTGRDRSTDRDTKGFLLTTY